MTKPAASFKSSKDTILTQPIAEHAVADLVVILRKHDKALRAGISREELPWRRWRERRILAGIDKALAIGFAELRKLPIVLVVAGAVAGEQRAQTMMKIVVPLGIEIVPAALARTNQSGVVVGAFRDQKNLPFGAAPQSGAPQR